MKSGAKREVEDQWDSEAKKKNRLISHNQERSDDDIAGSSDGVQRGSGSLPQFPATTVANNSTVVGQTSNANDATKGDATMDGGSTSALLINTTLANNSTVVGQTSNANDATKGDGGTPKEPSLDDSVMCPLSEKKSVIRNHPFAFEPATIDFHLKPAELKPKEASKRSTEQPVATIDVKVKDSDSRARYLGGTYKALFSGASARREPTDAYDDFVGTMSVLLRSCAEDHAVLLVHRLLQEDALWDMVRKGNETDSTLRPPHLKKLYDLFKDGKSNANSKPEILAMVVNNLILNTDLQSTPSGNNYDKYGLVETLAFLRSYEPILAPSSLAIRERHINFDPQRIHGIYAQQKSNTSRSSRGSHAQLNPHTENGYDESDAIPQAFSLVCVRPGERVHKTPTHLISAREILHDMGLLRGKIEDFKRSQPEWIAKYQKRVAKYQKWDDNALPITPLAWQKQEEMPQIGNLGDYNHSSAAPWQAEYEIHLQCEDRLRAEKFDMYEGPTMDKQRSNIFSILTIETDRDGEKHVTWRLNLNIRETIKDFKRFKPGAQDISDPSYNEDIYKLWNELSSEEMLNNLFPNVIFGDLAIKEKEDNLKLLLALRTCPKTKAGVEILRDMIWVFHSLSHGDGIPKLYKDQFFVKSSANIRGRAKPHPVHWERGYAAMFRNKEVFHYRSNFSEQFQSFKTIEESFSTEDKEAFNTFWQSHFGDNAFKVAKAFSDLVLKILVSEDEQYRFFKTYINIIKFSEDMALILLMPKLLYGELKFKNKDSVKIFINQFLDIKGSPEMRSYSYLLQPHSYNSAWLQDIIKNFETRIPQIIGQLMNDFPDISKEEGTGYFKLLSLVNKQIDTSRKVEHIKGELVETRDARWLIRTYLKDSDNHELPSHYIFQSRILERIMGEKNLGSLLNLEESSQLKALSEFEQLYQECYGYQIDSYTMVTDESRMDIVKDEVLLAHMISKRGEGCINKMLTNLSLSNGQANLEIVKHIRDVIDTANMMLADDPGMLNIKNIVKFTHQLRQYQIGCKIIAYMTDNAVGAVDSGWMSGEEVKEDFVNYLFEEIKSFNLNYAFKDGSILDKSAAQGGLGLTACEKDIFISITSMPDAEKFKAFVQQANPNDLQHFSLLNAFVSGEDKLNKEVFKDPSFELIMKIAHPSYKIKDVHTASIIDRQKKDLLSQKDELLELRKDLKPEKMAEVVTKIKQRLVDKEKFLNDAINRSQIAQINGREISKMNEVELKSEISKVDYFVDRWYHADYMEVKLKEGDDVIFQKADILKMVKLLRSKSHKVEYSQKEGKKLVLNIDQKSYEFSAYDTMVPGSLCRVTQDQLDNLKKDFAFSYSIGEHGEKDHLILERRPWFDEYDRDPIKKEEGAEIVGKIKDLIAQKARLRAGLRKKDIERRIIALDISGDNSSILDAIISSELKNIEYLLRTTNDLKLNYSATLAEKAFALDLLVSERIKKRAAKMSEVNENFAVKYCDFARSSDGKEIFFSEDQLRPMLVKAKYLMLEHNDPFSDESDRKRLSDAGYEIVKNDEGEFTTENIFFIYKSETKEFFCSKKDIVFKYNSETKQYSCSEESLKALGFKVSENSIFIKKKILTLKVKEELLYRDQQSINDYSGKVDKAWREFEGAELEIKLRELRHEERKLNTVIEDASGYSIPSNIYTKLVESLKSRNCQYNDQTQIFTFFVIKDDSVEKQSISISAESSSSQQTEQRYKLSKEDFEILSTYFKLEYDEEKSRLYFSETHLPYSIPIKPHNPKQEERDKHNPKHKERDTYIISNYINKYLYELSHARDLMRKSNEVLFRGFIELVIDLEICSSKFNVAVLEQKLEKFNRQPNFGTKFIQDNIRELVRNFVQPNPKLDNFGKEIEKWEEALKPTYSSSSSSADMEAVKKQKLLNFMSIVKNWHEELENTCQ
ncbi:MAG: hypothetical protein HOM96_01575, partial [Rickettsiales bacterium]|nr:hypothetical protein [Rickettsiales bacterium]